MITLHSLKFQGDRFYQEPTELPCGMTGMVLLRGVNRDADRPGVSNGSGKTRLTQILQGFIFGATARGHFRRFVGPEFVGTLDFTDRVHRWNFTYEAKEGTWEIQRDGQPHPPPTHRPSDTQALLQKLIGFSPREWTSYVQITGRSIETLLRGQPAERRQALEKFFGLDEFYGQKQQEYEAEVQHLKTQIDLIEQDRQRLDEVRAQLGRQSGSGWLARQVEAAREVLVIVRGQRDQADQRLRRADQGTEAWDQYQTLYMETVDIPSVDSLVARRDQSTQQLTVQYQERRDRQAALQAAALLQTLEAQDQQDRLESPDLPEPEPQMVADLEVKLEQMRRKVALKHKVADLTAALPDCRPDDEPGLQEALKAIQGRQAELQHHLELLARGGSCHQCGQRLPFLDRDTPEDLARQYRAELQGLNREVQEIHEVLACIGRYRSTDRLLQDARQQFDELPSFGLRVQDVQDQLDDHRALLTAWREYRRYAQARQQLTQGIRDHRATLDRLDYPAILERPDQVDALKADLDTVTRQLALVASWSLAKQRVEGLDPRVQLAAEAELQGLVLADLEGRIDQLNRLDGQMTEQLQRAQATERQVVDLTRRLADAEQTRREYRVLQGMVRFYSNRGFKLYELKRRCQLLIDRANFWSPTFFQEPYRWSLPEDLDQIDFLVQPVNHKTEPYPAGDLSAGEENRAARVLLFSQLEMRPASKRINLLELDEIEANLDEVGFMAFTDVVVPKLREAFPDTTIVLVSHQKSLRNIGVIDHQWVAERKDRKTRLNIYPFCSKKAAQ